MRSQIVYLTDDFTGKADEGVETISFMMEDGKLREIDLNPKNARIFREKNKRYVDASRIVTPKPSAKRKNNKRNVAQRREDAAAIREWANAQGIEVEARGRIPKDVLEMYDSRNSSEPVIPGPSHDEMSADYDASMQG